MMSNLGSVSDFDMVKKKLIKKETDTYLKLQQQSIASSTLGADIVDEQSDEDISIRGNKNKRSIP